MGVAMLSRIVCWGKAVGDTDFKEPEGSIGQEVLSFSQLPPIEHHIWA
jgi:hypothetical protein